MDKGTVQEISFYSSALNETLNLLIYIPANYSPFEQYNILIASDGRDYFQLGALPRLADQLLDDYMIENVLIVGIPYKNAADRKRKYIPSGDQFEGYLSFLVEELIPYLDNEYSTYNSAEGRALIGDSMAATIALMAAVRYPHIFNRAILQSPYVDELVLDEVRKLEHSKQLSLYHLIGLGETEVITTDKSVKDFLTPNRALHELIVQKEIPHYYEEIDGNHTWTSWKPELKRALIEIFG